MSKIYSDDEGLELLLVYPVFKIKKIKIDTPDGPITQEVQKLFKEIGVRRWFRKESITLVEEYVTSKFKVSKSRSVIFDKYSARFYNTFHSYNDVKSHLGLKNTQIKQKPIGYGSNFYPGKT